MTPNDVSRWERFIQKRVDEISGDIPITPPERVTKMPGVDKPYLMLPLLIGDSVADVPPTRSLIHDWDWQRGAYAFCDGKHIVLRKSVPMHLTDQAALFEELLAQWADDLKSMRLWSDYHLSTLGVVVSLKGEVLSTGESWMLSIGGVFFGLTRERREVKG